MSKDLIPENLINQINKMDETQLRFLNNLVVERIKLMTNAKSFMQMSQFNLGDDVSFDHYGEFKSGTIIKLNKKTASVLVNGSEQWNVSPALLKKKD